MHSRFMCTPHGQQIVHVCVCVDSLLFHSQKGVQRRLGLQKSGEPTVWEFDETQREYKASKLPKTKQAEGWQPPLEPDFLLMQEDGYGVSGKYK